MDATDAVKHKDSKHVALTIICLHILKNYPADERH